MTYEAYLRALVDFVGRQEKTSIARIGAGELPWGKQFNTARWNRELADELQRLGVRPDHAIVSVQFNSYIERQLEGLRLYGERVERVNGVRAVYADLRSRCERIARALADTATTPRVDWESEPRPQMLYRLYDEMGTLLYVGITDRGPTRLVEHYRRKPWFHMVLRIELERYATRAEVESREVEAIRTLRPLYNIQHNRQDRGSGSLRPVAIAANAQRSPVST